MTRWIAAVACLTSFLIASCATTRTASVAAAQPPSAVQPEPSWADLTPDQKLQVIVALYNDGEFGAAVRAMRMAAEEGIRDAQFILGVAYLAGEHVEQDPARAARLLEQAGRQGHAEAARLRGAMYLAGLGGPKDERQARRWLQRAAEGGDAEAQTILGALYVAGIGGSEDREEGEHWLRKAAQGGNADAQQLLQQIRMAEFLEGLATYLQRSGRPAALAAGR
jgi:TPR repeat protein